MCLLLDGSAGVGRPGEEDAGICSSFSYREEGTPFYGIFIKQGFNFVLATVNYVLALYK